MAKTPVPAAAPKPDLEWHVLALKAASDLLDGNHQQKLQAEAWWRDQLKTTRAVQPLDAPHFLPTSAAR